MCVYVCVCLCSTCTSFTCTYLCVVHVYSKEVIILQNLVIELCDILEQGRIQEFGRGGSNNYIHKGAEPQKPTPFYYIKLKILHKHVQQI